MVSPVLEVLLQASGCAGSVVCRLGEAEVSWGVCWWGTPSSMSDGQVSVAD